MEFLQDFTVLDTKHINEAREIVGRSFCSHKLEVLNRHKRFHARHGATSGHLLTLNYLSYGETVLIEPGELESFYLIQIPLDGYAEIRSGGDLFDSSCLKAAILNPDRHTKMTWHANCRQLIVYIAKDKLRDVAEKYLDRRLDFGVVFQSELDCQIPEIANWRNLILTLAMAADKGDLFGQSTSLSQLLFEEKTIVDLLQIQPSNVHCFANHVTRSIAPKRTKMAYEYIIENAACPIGLVDIANFSGLPIRTLQHQFSQSYGFSPIEVLKQERLRRVFHELNSGLQTDGISSVASKWGFSHMGRFARYYSSAFGENPSQTKRNAISRQKHLVS